MTRGSAWRAATAGLALAAGVVLPGCAVYQQPVLVVGRDAAGTLVVGAGHCDGEDLDRPEMITVYDPTSRQFEDLWAVDGGPGPHVTAEEDAPPAPAAPDPGELGPVGLLAVGDPAPAGYTVYSPLREELPSRSLVVEVTIDDDDFDDIFLEASVHPEGPADRYEVVSSDRSEGDLDAGAATALVEDICADDGSRTVRNTVISGVVAVVLVLVGGIVLGTMAKRQYRRAGAAHARRLAGLPPDDD